MAVNLALAYRQHREGHGTGDVLGDGLPNLRSPP